MPPAGRSTDDAWAKASGAARYAADLTLMRMLRVALVRAGTPAVTGEVRAEARGEPLLDAVRLPIIDSEA